MRIELMMGVRVKRRRSRGVVWKRILLTEYVWFLMGYLGELGYNVCQISCSL